MTGGEQARKLAYAAAVTAEALQDAKLALAKAKAKVVELRSDLELAEKHAEEDRAALFEFLTHLATRHDEV